jgi:DNA topoisomerase-1
LQPKSKIVADIKEDAKNADEIFLATDPDREGEAIS